MLAASLPPAYSGYSDCSLIVSGGVCLGALTELKAGGFHQDQVLASVPGTAAQPYLVRR